MAEFRVQLDSWTGFTNALISQSYDMKPHLKPVCKFPVTAKQQNRVGGAMPNSVYVSDTYIDDGSVSLECSRDSDAVGARGQCRDSVLDGQLVPLVK